MTTSTVDPLLDIPGRSVAQNSCAQKPTVVPPARRTMGLAPLYLIAVISFGALAATVGFSAADLPSPSTQPLQSVRSRQQSLLRRWRVRHPSCCEVSRH